MAYGQGGYNGSSRGGQRSSGNGGGYNNSRGNSGGARGGYGGGRGRQQQQQSQRDPSQEGTLKFMNFEPEEWKPGKKYPALTGFANLSPELLRRWLDAVENNPELVNPEYGTIAGIQVTLWEQQDGSLSGTIKQWIPEPEEEDEPQEAPAAKSGKFRTMKTEAAPAVAPKSTKKRSTGGTATQASATEGEQADFDDIPF